MSGPEGAELEAERADPLLRQYASDWLATRVLKPRTRDDYGKLLEANILPPLGTMRLSRLTPARVREWYGKLDSEKETSRARTYGLLRTIMNTAIADDLIDQNPCRIRGAGRASTKHDTEPATLHELEVIVRTIAPRYRLMVLLAAWCGLRFGELTELRRSDVSDGKLRVRRGVVRVQGKFIVGDPKSDAGVRDVAIPPHLSAVIEQHLMEHVRAGADALMFPAASGGHMAPSTLYRVWYPARDAAGRPDLHFHDLRHTGATYAAHAGATLAELMRRLGHSTPGAAMRYQHAVNDRDSEIAKALSGFAASGVAALVPRSA